MKRTLLIICASAVLLAHSASAAFNFSWSPTSQTVAAGNTFQVTLRLQITGSPPTSVVGWDMIIEALRTQNAIDLNGLFAVTAVSSLVTTGNGFSGDWLVRSGVPSFPETMTVANGDHQPTFMQTTHNLGFNGDSIAASAFSSPTGIALFTFSTSASIPTGTYTFQNTGDYTANPGGGPSLRFSDIGDGTTIYHATASPFSINITAVPEPATWSLVALGGLAAVGVNVLRARRKS